MSKIPVTFIFSVPFVHLNSSEIKKKVVKEYSLETSFEEVVAEIESESLHPSLPTKQDITVVVGRGLEAQGCVESTSTFDTLSLERAFSSYAADATTTITINVSTAWPSFPNPFGQNEYGDGQCPKTLAELRMMRLSAEIRRKDLWFEKLLNPEILAKWSEEARAEGFTPNQISYVLEELKYYATLRDTATGIQVSDIDGVWHSDTLVDLKLRDELLSGVAELEDIPESKRDWHPGSKDQVWDLVHPSLYPLVYGETRQLSEGQVTVPSLRSCGAGEILEFDPAKAPNGPTYSVSKRFTWLPSDFMIHADGHVTIESYINNLHPVHHRDLYSTLAKIFAKFVPLFENVLYDQVNLRSSRIVLPEYGNWYGNAEYVGDSEDEDYDYQYEEWYRSRPVIHPDAPPTFVPPSRPANPIRLLGCQVQVIVKLANIMLTPKNSKYPGGVWHVEGMKNENIVATGIYYFDVDNISDSELSFRQGIREPDYEQNDTRGVYEVYGLSNEDALNQKLGSVLTKGERCLAFPNMYQHRVKPFELADKTRPGHRKILVFFLVHPGTRIPSTLTIPPQQLDWYVEELAKIPPFSTDLPSEVFDYLVKFLDWPVSLRTAKKWRQELMDERKYFISANNEESFQRPFSLCEH